MNENEMYETAEYYELDSIIEYPEHWEANDENS